MGERLGARLSVVLIGERPGLSVADSLGLYLTYEPRPGRRDSERNCISNVHGRGGLSRTSRRARWRGSCGGPAARPHRRRLKDGIEEALLEGKASDHPDRS